MRAVLQRVSFASVKVADEIVGAIDRGWLVLLGIAPTDTESAADWLGDKIVGLRAFPDPDGKMNLSVQEVSGAVLVVSQFTLYGDCQKGRRPSFVGAARPEVAEPLYEAVIRAIRRHGVSVATGRFGADMSVTLVNDGPVTLLLDSPTP